MAQTIFFFFQFSWDIYLRWIGLGEYTEIYASTFLTIGVLWCVKKSKFVKIIYYTTNQILFWGIIVLVTFVSKYFVISKICHSFTIYTSCTLQIRLYRITADLWTELQLQLLFKPTCCCKICFHSDLSRKCELSVKAKALLPMVTPRKIREQRTHKSLVWKKYRATQTLWARLDMICSS